MPTSGDDYVHVQARLVRKLRNSFVFENRDGDNVIIGHGTIYGPDFRTIEDATDGEELEFQMFHWLARKENLV